MGPRLVGRASVAAYKIADIVPPASAGRALIARAGGGLKPADGPDSGARGLRTAPKTAALETLKQDPGGRGPEEKVEPRHAPFARRPRRAGRRGAIPQSPDSQRRQGAACGPRTTCASLARGVLTALGARVSPRVERLGQDATELVIESFPEFVLAEPLHAPEEGEPPDR